MQWKAKAWYLLHPLQRKKQVKTRQDDTRQVRKPDIMNKYKKILCTVHLIIVVFKHRHSNKWMNYSQKSFEAMSASIREQRMFSRVIH